LKIKQTFAQMCSWAASWSASGIEYPLSLPPLHPPKKPPSSLLLETLKMRNGEEKGTPWTNRFLRLSTENKKP
jgi:hypothetical protein